MGMGEVYTSIVLLVIENENCNFIVQHSAHNECIDLKCRIYMDEHMKHELNWNNYGS